MMKPVCTVAIIAASLAAVVVPAHAADGNPSRGQRVFAACAPCHSLEPNRNMTGPTLADVWNRRAGTVKSFSRYSPAMQSSDVVWNDKTLDAWIADPQHLVPGNQMIFQGIKDGQQRADLLAFLKEATQPGGKTAQAMRSGQMANAVPNLKQLEAEDRVQAIKHCNDTYRVTTGDGKTHDFWERNLRFKTDSSDEGPQKGAPAIVGAGMVGDRASVIFASPDEISPLIANGC
jgi:cytochrome c